MKSYESATKGLTGCGGSYLVARRIRIALEHWDRSEVDLQEQAIGRDKYSGAPYDRYFLSPDGVRLETPQAERRSFLEATRSLSRPRLP